MFLQHTLILLNKLFANKLNMIQTLHKTLTMSKLDILKTQFYHGHLTIIHNTRQKMKYNFKY